MIEAECHWIMKRLKGLKGAKILDIAGGTHYGRLRVQSYAAYELHRPLLLQGNHIEVLEQELVHRKKDLVYSLPLELLSRIVAVFPNLKFKLANFLPLAQTILADCRHIPKPSSNYDVFFLLNLLEHTLDPTLAFTEAVRIIKKGGQAFISVPEICPYHPSPIDTGLRMNPGELVAFVSSHLTVIETASLSDEPSCRVSIVYCRKE